MTKLSVVIPTFNESSTGKFLKILEVYKKFPHVQVVVSDGGSTDDTIEVARNSNAKLVHVETMSRAERINHGVEKADGELILLNHPRSLLTHEGVDYLIQNAHNLNWGGFTHVFDHEHPFLKFTSWYSNEIRCKRRGILYLDHCKFARKEYMKSACPLPNVDIFEDTILSSRLKQIAGLPTLVPYKSTTSAIRFQKNGMFKQGLLNQYLKQVLKIFYGSLIF